MNDWTACLTLLLFGLFVSGIMASAGYHFMSCVTEILEWFKDDENLKF